MASSVAVYHIPGHKRSSLVATSMLEGIRRSGDQVRLLPSYSGRSSDADIAVFYGFDRQLQRVFNSYRSANKTVVFVDLGYLGRTDGGRFSGYHKVSVNSRHPTAYFQKQPHDSSRLDRFGINVKDWRQGTPILIAGMSAKAALASGFEPQQWETMAIATIRRRTDRPIIYRPKPSWLGATPIPGSLFAHSRSDIVESLNDCYAVVTHHSNVGIDALIAGVPVFCSEGVASPLALSDLTKIEMPRRDGDRHQLLCDLSYCQWTIGEMIQGLPWQHLRNEGLIP